MARNLQYDHEYKMQAIKLAKELDDCAKAVTDITEIKCKDGKLYVSAIFDCFDLTVLGLRSKHE